MENKCQMNTTLPFALTHSHTHTHSIAAAWQVICILCFYSCGSFIHRLYFYSSFKQMPLMLWWDELLAQFHGWGWTHTPTHTVFQCDDWCWCWKKRQRKGNRTHIDTCKSGIYVVFSDQVSLQVTVESLNVQLWHQIFLQPVTTTLFLGLNLISCDMLH